MKKFVIIDVFFIIITAIGVIYYFITPTGYGLAVLEALGRMVICFIALCVEVLILIMAVIVWVILRKRKK
jgi:hypothetical protein